ncbi:MAG: hypothetical protein K9J16_07470 [Melioribacteraceae bacterium]|nr:hypothetical protein [Melioribacteraceae bacterium]MCF8353432.1 hypothetical protein [Melioribacteraceae bacterium]MCF8393920.1 hypothetical protein [Melioribacteraceae bacterium]MCF8418993.1 hypothetical protein [Melioribacteraceae bacterium]
MMVSNKVIVVFFLIFSFNIYAQEYVDARYFSDIFSRACNNVTNLKTEEIVIDNTVNAFRAYIYGEYAPGGYGMTDVFWEYTPSAFLNYGKYFTFAYYSPAFQPKFKDIILEELEDIKEDYIDEYDDINPTWVIDNNSKIYLTAKYFYNDDGGDIQDRIHFLMATAQRISYKIKEQNVITMYDWKDELEDIQLDYLSRYDLNSLMPNENFEKYAKEDAAVTEGSYGYTLRGIDVEVRNHGKRIELVYEDFLPDDHSNDASIVDKLKTYAQENKPEGNPQIDVLIPTDLPNNIWVVATYNFDKSFTGDDFIDYFDDFMDDFLDDMDSEFDDIIDDLD